MGSSSYPSPKFAKKISILVRWRYLNPQGEGSRITSNKHNRLVVIRNLFVVRQEQRPNLSSTLRLD